MNLRNALKEGLTLLEYTILVALARKPSLSRGDLENETGISEPSIRRATIRLSQRGFIQPDREHVVGGRSDRGARYSLTQK